MTKKKNLKKNRFLMNQKLKMLPGKTSFTKFMKLLADELNVEDLTPAQLVIKCVYDKATEKKDFPSDKKIGRTVKKLPPSPRIDLDDVIKPPSCPTKNNIDDSYFEATSESTMERAADLMMTPMFNSQIRDVENPIIENPRKSTDLEHGQYIPEAATLTWKDGFFMMILKTLLLSLIMTGRPC
ncbi:hypothetical protein IV203_027632 [Nitzschia inconspicua]|uniref:Uncharacterized protein n=1 Tax=Nitzschia inconspicua TaxID=303405 RepID=A0A9K3M087_9STRA|nr:hypothetical protein IV203_027632 [Nitzschia inconspicua]